MILLFASTEIAWAKSKPSTQEKLLYKLLNRERRKEGLSRLKRSGRIERAAQNHSRDMIENNYFSHIAANGTNLADRLGKSGVKGWQCAGENLAGAPSVKVAFKMLLKSPAHKRNMLKRKYTKVGIDVTKGGPYGLMITMDFIEKH